MPDRLPVVSCSRKSRDRVETQQETEVTTTATTAAVATAAAAATTATAEAATTRRVSRICPLRDLSSHCQLVTPTASTFRR